MSPGLVAAFAGLGTGLSLIVAIGAQNAFVLRQGIRRAHVPVIVAICVGSDLVLITGGIVGIGAVVRAAPVAIEVVTVVGGAFLVCYGLFAARRALREVQLDATAGEVSSRSATMFSATALTWLNPHVYLDTVLLLGSVGNSYGADRWWFAAGAVTGSAVWFSGLGFGARLLHGLFARPLAWRVLDLLIAIIMLTLAAVMFDRLSR